MNDGAHYPNYRLEITRRCTQRVDSQEMYGMHAKYRFAPFESTAVVCGHHQRRKQNI